MATEIIEVFDVPTEIVEVLASGPQGPAGPQPDINYTVVSSNTTLQAADLIAADTSGGTFTLTLPLNPSNGDAVDIFDFSETFDTNPLTIARNGSRIESLEENLVCNVEGAYFTLIYTGATRGWQVLPRYGTSGGGGESALTTQGDMLYRGAAVNTRLGIGTAGQILKVNSSATAPEWGEAPATGVTSVSGTAPIASSGGATPTISITAATTSAAGSMSSADKTKLDAITGTNTGDQTITLTGNVTGSGTGSFATTIANDAVDNTKLSNMAQSTLKGRATASTGDPEDLTATQVRTILNVADGAEVNVQSNWTEADSGSDAFILNKPTLGNSAALDVGTTTGTVAAGDDARLSDTRDPNAHAASHAAAGSDPVFDQDLNTGDDVAFNSFTVGDIGVGSGTLTWAGDDVFSLEDGTFFKTAIFDDGMVLLDGDISFSGDNAATNAATTRTNLGLGDAATADIGTGSTEVAAGDHSHELDELDATGATNGHVLTADGSNGASWQAAAGGGVTGAAASASDILGVSGSDITGVDATADRIVFWDDSASALKYLEAGSGLSISETTMTVTATGGATNLWIPASAWIPKTTAGCGVDSRETTTNDQNFDELLFDTGSDELADALVIMPSNYNNSTVTARFYWTAASGSGGVAWAIQGRAFANDDALDTAAGTAQLVTDTLITANDMHVTSATSAATIGGTPAANTPIQFTIYRDVSDAADTLSVDARLLGVEILFN